MSPLDPSKLATVTLKGCSKAEAHKKDLNIVLRNVIEFLKEETIPLKKPMQYKLTIEGNK